MLIFIYVGNEVLILDKKNRLAEFRKKKNLRQTQVSTELGITPQAISLYERGDREPKPEMWEKFSKLYGEKIPVLKGIELNDDDKKSEIVDVLYNYYGSQEIVDGSAVPIHGFSNSYDVVDIVERYLRAVGVTGKFGYIGNTKKDIDEMFYDEKKLEYKPELKIFFAKNIPDIQSKSFINSLDENSAFGWHTNDEKIIQDSDDRIIIIMICDYLQNEIYRIQNEKIMKEYPDKKEFDDALFNIRIDLMSIKIEDKQNSIKKIDKVIEKLESIKQKYLN